MKDLWMNPVVLGAAGVIVVGFVLLILAVRALKKSSKPGLSKEFDFPSILRSEPLSVVTPDSNPFSANAVVPPPVAVANKDVLERVDLISQRLVDMQMLLNKQVTNSAHAATTASNPGLPPEMLDKLLKIASSVAQQIDVLQKALGGEGTGAAQAAAASVAFTDPGPAAAAAPRPASSMMPVSQVIGSAAKPSNPPANP